MANPDWSGLRHLVIVPGHAVYISNSFEHPASDENWQLEGHQFGKASFFIEHIRRGVDIADNERAALLVFSGGQTRYQAGPRSEALSYWALAENFDWWWRTNVRLRAVTEEFARDSFENLLFSICRFNECVGAYPESITVVGWGFKKKRFAFHRDTIRWKRGYAYDAINDPVDIAKAEKGERENAYLPFKLDPYGKGSPRGSRKGKQRVDLAMKRQERNPFLRTPPYALSCSEVRGVLEHDGQGAFPGRLPWQPPDDN